MIHKSLLWALRRFAYFRNLEAQNVDLTNHLRKQENTILDLRRMVSRNAGELLDAALVNEAHRVQIQALTGHDMTQKQKAIQRARVAQLKVAKRA